MKRALFNFFVLQLMVWAFVFYDGSSSETGLNLSEFPITLQPSRVVENSAAQASAFAGSKLRIALKENGSFVLKTDENQSEAGNWFINKSKTKLTLIYKNGVREYNIIQLPHDSSETLIIGKNDLEAFIPQNIELELTNL